LASCLHLNGLEKLPSLPSSGVDSRGANVDAVVKTRATVNDELSSKGTIPLNIGTLFLFATLTNTCDCPLTPPLEVSHAYLPVVFDDVQGNPL
jgi:hypothetical protein